MAPVDSDAAARNNTLPVVLFAGQALLVAGLTANVLHTARHAAKSLPPSARTRSQNPLRRRNAVVFSTLAFLSLASVTTFAVIWRAISYIQWADQGNHGAPGSLWMGWYGTGEEGVGHWHLGDWIADIDLTHELDAVAVLKPEGFLYTSQHFIGLIASAIFMGVEGHRRNLSVSTIASFVLLSATGSLGYALSLFFVTILYTPLTVHQSDTPLYDTCFAPRPAVYDTLIVASLLFLNAFPVFLEHDGDVRFLRLGYLAVPLLFAFAPKIVPLRLGTQHSTKMSAHRSYTKVYHALSIASCLFYWRLVATNVLANTPPVHPHIWDVFTNTIGKHDASKTNRILSGLSVTGQKLKHISAHPAISVTSLDVLFTCISLLAWTFTRNLDVDDILESSVLSFLASKHEKHVSFQRGTKPSRDHESESEPEAPVETTPKNRGQPKKSSGIGTSPSQAPSTRRLTRSTYGKGRSADSTYQPTPTTKRDVAETEADGATTDGDLIDAGESTALALFLTFVGGLGQLAAGALGAEVAGPRE